MPKYFLLLFVLACGLWLYRYSNVVSADRYINGGTVSIHGVVNDIPNSTKTYQSFHVNALKVVVDNPNQLVNFGDVINVTGQYQNGVVNHTTVTVVNYPIYTGVLAKIASVNTTLTKIPAAFLPTRSAALITGMVLGRKVADYPFLTALQNTGTIHILIASDANLTMLAGVVLTLQPILGKKKTLSICFVFTWLYVLLTATQPPIIRAAIMISLTYGALLYGKQYWDFYGLFLSAVVMLIVNPLLLFSISWQLSFMATLGIILYAKPIEQWIARLTSLSRNLPTAPRFVRDAIATTVAAQLFVDPLILFHFQQVSFLSILVNILVAPTVFYLTIVGATFVILGYFSHMLASMLAALLYLPSNYFISVVLYFARKPYIMITTQPISAFWITCYYVIVIAFILKRALADAYTTKTATNNSDKIKL